MRFADIPQFTRSAPYSVNIFWHHLERWVAEQTEQGLDINPDFQRGHVWTRKQQIAYVEFALRGGRSGQDILTNHPGWQNHKVDGPYVLVDGKQRLTAVLSFLHDEFPVFGNKFSAYEDKTFMRVNLNFSWHVNDLQTRAEVLRWYLDLNTGGTVHSDEEIAKVRALLEQAR